jgi:hypothetical protein
MFSSIAPTKELLALDSFRFTTLVSGVSSAELEEEVLAGFHPRFVAQMAATSRSS